VVILGFEPRQTDLARGIVVFRSRRLLHGPEQVEIIRTLSAVGMTEAPDDERPLSTERQLLAVPWAPPTRDLVELHRQCLDDLAARYDLEAAWFYKVETSIDGIAWADAMREAESSTAADDTTAETSAAPPGAAPPEVVFTAHDAPAELGEDATDPAQGAASADPDATRDDDTELDEDTEDAEWDPSEIESHWRNGPPPIETSVPFPLDRYPEIVDDFQWEDFAIALKLGGDPVAGEDSVINAFFALWLSVYQDERLEGFEAIDNADAIHDRPRRSALLWVERIKVPAPPTDQIHFLMWVVSRLHEIVPIAWARFDQSDVRQESHDDVHGAIVLAGNPLIEKFRRYGEQAALLWAASQSLWDRRELAAMLIEIAVGHDPDITSEAEIAERLLLRAADYDPHCEAIGYLCSVLIRQKRFDDALQRVRAAADGELLSHFLAQIVEHDPHHLGEALTLAVPPAVDSASDQDLAQLATLIAEKAPSQLPGYLQCLPERGSLVPYLYNASFPVPRAQSLAILSKVISLPEPAQSAEAARTAYVMAWNNACIHAHALGDYQRASQLADQAQRFGPENPYIFHSAACAYAAQGQTDRAIAQIKSAIAHGYDHVETMETDVDLGPLLAMPEFRALFSEWRAQQDNLN
jgi:tetratricopeptide (TPR) repeat protein